RRPPLAAVPAIPGGRAGADARRRLHRHRGADARLGQRLLIRLLPRQLHPQRPRGPAAGRPAASPRAPELPVGQVRRGLEHADASGALHHRLERRGRRAAEALMAPVLIAILSLTVLGIPIALALDRAARGMLLVGTAFLYGSG